MTVFNDFCTWAGNGLELWTGQTYSTGSYYCQPGAKSCINLSVQYLCGDGSAYSVTYAGCMVSTRCNLPTASSKMLTYTGLLQLRH